MSGPKYSDAQKAACAKREVRLRQQVYPGLVARGKMSFQESEREIEMMREIAEEYDTQGALAL